MEKNSIFYYPIYNVGYFEVTIGVVWLVLVVLDGGIGCIGYWEGSTWPMTELNDSIVVRDRVKTSAINVGK